MSYIEVLCNCLIIVKTPIFCFVLEVSHPIEDQPIYQLLQTKALDSYHILDPPQGPS